MGLTGSRVQSWSVWMLALTVPACSYWEKGPAIDSSVKFYEGFDTAQNSTVLPKGWRVARTNGAGASPRWDYEAVGNDTSDLAIRLTGSSAKKDTLNLCLYEEARWTNVNIYVDVGPRSGSGDQGGGIVWKALDDMNYYAAEWNPRENKVRAFKIVKGAKELLSAGDVAPMEAEKFRILHVKSEGSRYSIELDGVNVFEFVDGTFATPGFVGLWTTGDALTAFDKFTAVSIP